MTEIVSGHGHVNILATHKATLEFTKETHLSQMGDCIVTVGIDKAGVDLDNEFRHGLTNDAARLTIVIVADEMYETINAMGSSRLSLTHAKDMVIRKSDFVCSRTLAVRADKAAKDLDRRLIEKLKNPKNQVRISLTIHL